MVVIRLARRGSVNSPKYRITVADSRRAATAKFLDVVGSYIPNPSGQEKELVLDMTRTQEWIKKGAQPTERVRSLIRQAQKQTTA